MTLGNVVDAEIPDPEPFAVVLRDRRNGSDYLSVGGIGGYYVYGNGAYLENDAFNINACFEKAVAKREAEAYERGLKDAHRLPASAGTYSV